MSFLLSTVQDVYRLSTLFVLIVFACYVFIFPRLLVETCCAMISFNAAAQREEQQKSQTVLLTSTMDSNMSPATLKTSASLLVWRQLVAPTIPLHRLGELNGLYQTLNTIEQGKESRQKLQCTKRAANKAQIVGQ